MGFVLARDDANMWLPTALQVEGEKFEGLRVLEVTGAWERGVIGGG